MICPICYEEQENYLYLSCGHNICLNCYLCILEKNNELKCCLCRKLIHNNVDFLPFNNENITASYILNENIINVYYNDDLIKKFNYVINEFCELCIKMRNNKRNFNFYIIMCLQIINHFKTYKTIQELKNIDYFRIAYIYKNFNCELEYNNDILNINLHNKNCKYVY